MDVFKKSITLGLTLLACCVFVESTGICKFAKMFPPKKKNGLTINDTSQEDKEKNESNNSQTVTTAGKSLTENVTTAREEIFPKTSPQIFFDHHLRNTTAILRDAHVTTSPATAERATAPGTDCPSGYTRQLNNSCYKFVVSSPGNRSAARSACKGDSSHLVFIETKEENDFLVREAGSITQYWIGVHERPNLFWDNGNQVTFANIDPDDPQTFNEITGCYRMSRNSERYWFDSDCFVRHGYICEYEGAGCPCEFNNQFNESCYKFVNSGATMSQARSACQSDASHLVFVETKEENDFLVKEAKNNTNYWIGIHERRNLFWDDGNQVIFANINLDPNEYTFNDATGCYRMAKTSKRYWFDSSCSRRYDYICECEGDGCPSEFNKQFNESCYKFVDSGANISAARSACEGDSSHLMFIETKEENDFLVREAEGKTNYWIGIHERPNIFWDNGNQVTFANMNPDDLGTFDDATGCYIISYTDERYWRDSYCTGKYGFICEHKGTDCPDEYVKSNFSCYKFVDSASDATRSDARSACKRDSSHLVLIETKEENDFLIGQTKNDTEYWIGIHERPNFFWDNGNQVTFANIDPDDPFTFNDGTGCYAMSNNDGRWIDKNCSEQFGYICEYKGTASQK